MGDGEDTTALQLLIRTSWDPSRGVHGIGPGGGSAWWGRAASARQQCPGDDPGRKNCSEAMRTGRKAGGCSGAWARESH